MGHSLESNTQLQPLVIALGGKNRRRNWVILRSKSFPAKESCQPFPGDSLCPWLRLTLRHGCCAGFQSPTCQLGVKEGVRRANCSVPSDEG